MLLLLIYKHPNNIHDNMVFFKNVNKHLEMKKKKKIERYRTYLNSNKKI